jgi:capsular exopolysaccharide synthesis family protein
MSKNFELMQQAEIKLDIPAIGDVAPPPAEYIGHTNVNGNKGAVLAGPLAAREEAIKLVQTIFLLGGEESPRVVVFAGIDSGAGCSSICAQVAEVLASHKTGKVCVVDANLRAPSLPELFGVSNHNGLTDALSKPGSIHDFAKVVRLDNLWLLSCGSRPSESLRLLNSENMKARVAELRREFDYVLIDSSPLNTYSDGVVLGQLADGLVMVLEANSTRRDAATRVAGTLRAAQVRILGAVLNKRTFPIPETLYNLL